MTQTAKQAQNTLKDITIPPVQVLPDNPAAALHAMTEISRNMIDLAERETQTLIKGDMLAFTILQEEKEAMTRNYMYASNEFRKRLEEFRGLDSELIDRLANLQNSLGEKAQSNNKIVLQMKNKSQAATRKTLLTVQELAQKHPVTLNDSRN